MMTEENELSPPVKAGILKRIITKFTASKLSRAEKLDVLKRLFRKYSASRFSKPDTLKRAIKRLGR